MGNPLGFVRGYKASSDGVVLVDVDTGLMQQIAAQAVPPFDENLVMWFDPSTIIVAPGVPDRVLRWADKSGLAQDLIQATTNRQPTYLPPGQSGLPGFAGVQSGPGGAGRWLVANPVLDAQGNSITTPNSHIYLLARPLQDAIGTRTILGLSAGSQLDMFTFPAASGNQTPVLNYSFPPATQALFASWKDQPILFEIVGDSVNQSLYANGVLVAQAATSSPAASWSTMVLGSTSVPGDASSFPAVFYEGLVYVPPLSGVGADLWGAAERRRIKSYFTNKYGVQIVFDGNSQFFGGNNSGQGAALPGYTPHLVTDFWTNYINNGTNGITTPQLTARMVATTAPLFNPLSSRRGIVFLEIENDLVANGASVNPNDTSYAATAWANVIAYSRAARAAGVQFLVGCSCLPIGPLIPPPANYEKSRQVVNALMRQFWSYVDPTTNQPYFDGFADIGGPASPVGTVASTQNPNLYNPADEQHLNDGGVVACAPLIANAITAAFA